MTGPAVLDRLALTNRQKVIVREIAAVRVPLPSRDRFWSAVTDRLYRLGAHPSDIDIEDAVNATVEHIAGYFDRDQLEFVQDRMRGARQADAARLRSSWEPNYTGAIEAARAGDAARLEDLFRAKKIPTSEDFERLADYVHDLHRKPGRERDATVHDLALLAEALLDIVRSVTGHQNVGADERRRVYCYVCGIDSYEHHPERLTGSDAEKLEKLTDYIRRGRHLR